MKFLIWFFCLFVAAAISTACKMNGIILGGIPTVLLYGGAFRIAALLCKKLDSDEADSDTNENPLSPGMDTSDIKERNIVTLALPERVSSTMVVKNLSTDQVLWEGTGGEKIQFEVYGETNILVTWSKYSISCTVRGGEMYELMDDGLWRTKWKIVRS